LRNMWHQITQEMTALAKDGSQEELPNWMAQLPAVLQGIIPKTINTTGLNLQNGGNDNSDPGMDTQISEVGTEHDRRITKNHNEQSSGVHVGCARRSVLPAWRAPLGASFFRRLYMFKLLIK
jgi:hypothetical protein